MDMYAWRPFKGPGGLLSSRSEQHGAESWGQPEVDPTGARGCCHAGCQMLPCLPVSLIETSDPFSSGAWQTLAMLVNGFYLFCLNYNLALAEDVLEVRLNASLHLPHDALEREKISKRAIDEPNEVHAGPIGPHAKLPRAEVRRRAAD